LAGAFADDGASPGVPLGAERRLSGGDAGPPGPPGPDPIVERIVLPIVNEAFLALGEGVARSAADIDLALRLGAGHPRGPFEQLDPASSPASNGSPGERVPAAPGSRRRRSSWRRREEADGPPEGTSGRSVASCARPAPPSRSAGCVVEIE
jgi:hypothetical protein